MRIGYRYEQGGFEYTQIKGSWNAVDINWGAGLDSWLSTNNDVTADLTWSGLIAPASSVFADTQIDIDDGVVKSAGRVHTHTVTEN